MQPPPRQNLIAEGRKINPEDSRTRITQSPCQFIKWRGRVIIQRIVQGHLHSIDACFFLLPNFLPDRPAQLRKPVLDAAFVGVSDANCNSTRRNRVFLGERSFQQLTDLRSLTDPRCSQVSATSGSAPIFGSSAQSASKTPDTRVAAIQHF